MEMAKSTRTAHKQYETLIVGSRKYLRAEVEQGDTIRHLDILPDLPDIRDRIYQPHLKPLMSNLRAEIDFTVRNQGNANSCTGHSLAHIIDILRRRELVDGPPERVSAKMLYAMAQRNDEWADSPHEGSSLRGAIKGFFRNGVCSEIADTNNSGEWSLTYDMAKNARETRLGAYFRLQADLTDYHAALNDVGAIYVSAQIHSNWKRPKRNRIVPGGSPWGGHAFVIIGYDNEGFLVLNSWGEDWGNKGVAHWSYADWAATIMDAWVLQLGVRAPSAFAAIPGATFTSQAGFFGASDPERADILGHFVNIDDGILTETGKYASPTPKEMEVTVDRLVRPDSNDGDGYQHLVIYAHGGLNSMVAEARRIAAWKRADIFGRNGIYNFHLMWASGFLDELFHKMSSTSAGIAAGLLTDWIFETGPGKAVGSYTWRNMKGDADAAFGGEDPPYNGGYRGLRPLLEGLDASANRPKIHLVGHSAGSIVLGRLLSTLSRYNLPNLEIESIHLMAPACTVDFFKKYYGPYLDGSSKVKLRDKTYIYALSEALELKDTVGASFPFSPTYSRSLLHLVSRAFEEKPKTPIAGMEMHFDLLSKSPKLVTNVTGGKTESRTHGGFDNDARTMTSIMEWILGKKVPKPPKGSELEGY